MIAWLVGDEDDPRDVFEIGKASDVSEVRNWAARRVETDPELEDGAFPLFIGHSPWEGTWSTEELPVLEAELEALLILADGQVRYTPDDAWMVRLLQNCLAATRAARAARQQITVR